MQNKDKILVASIDFGTTFSACACSFITDYETNPLNIYVNQTWKYSSSNYLSMRTPTVVLLSKAKKVIAFGYDAALQYSMLALDEEHHDYYYFCMFKMLLQETKHLTRHTMIKDDNGKEMPALEIISLVIECLKDQLLETLKSKGTGVVNDNIHWVLTVQSIWTEPVKQFMREAAEKAGIRNEQLSICLKPDAASLYCQHLPVEKLKEKDGIGNAFTSSGKGDKYMVLDLGDGTAEITCHQMNADGSHQELHKPSSGHWNGSCVNEAFNQLLIKIFGAHHFRFFQKKLKADTLTVLHELDCIKRSITNETNGKVTLKLPTELFVSFEKDTEEETRDVIKQMAYEGNVTMMADKLRMDANLFRAFFDEPKTQLIKHVKYLLTTSQLKNVSTLLMVGRFSESPIMQSGVKEAFPDMKVLIPDNAGLAVLQGAVLYGHRVLARLLDKP